MDLDDAAFVEGATWCSDGVVVRFLVRGDDARLLRGHRGVGGWPVPELTADGFGDDNLCIVWAFAFWGTREF